MPAISTLHIYPSDLPTHGLKENILSSKENLNTNPSSEVINSIKDKSILTLNNLNSNKVLGNNQTRLGIEFEENEFSEDSISFFENSLMFYEEHEDCIRFQLANELSPAEKKIKLKEGRYLLKKEKNQEFKVNKEQIIFFDRAKAESKEFIFSNSNNNINFNNFKFSELSKSESNYLNSAKKVYLFYLENQEALKKLGDAEKKEKEAQLQYSILKINQNFSKKATDTKTTDRLSISTRNFSISPVKENLKIEQKLMEIEIFKEERDKKIEKKKLEQKLENRNFFEMNDLLKSAFKQEMLGKEIIKTANGILKFTKKFNFTLQTAKCTLKKAI